MEKSTKKREKALLPEIKILITERALSDPRSREELADELIVEIKNKYPHKVPPAWETVIKLISAARNHQPSPLDKPWHLGLTLDRYGLNKDYLLAAEDIAAIIEVQKWLEIAKDHPLLSSIPEWTDSITSGGMATTVWLLTIREALWISKLYKEKSLAGNTYRLWYAAKTYADYQRLCEISNTPPFDTIKLDEALRNDTMGKAKYDLFSEYKKEANDNERSHSQEG